MTHKLVFVEKWKFLTCDGRKITFSFPIVLTIFEEVCFFKILMGLFVSCMRDCEEKSDCCFSRSLKNIFRRVNLGIFWHDFSSHSKWHCIQTRRILSRNKLVTQLHIFDLENLSISPVFWSQPLWAILYLKRDPGVVAKTERHAFHLPTNTPGNSKSHKTYCRRIIIPKRSENNAILRSVVYVCHWICSCHQL